MTTGSTTRPLLVGERLNAQGSRRTKRLLLAGDYSALIAIAREQLAHGAQALDVCVALEDRHDEAARMTALVTRLAQAVDVPIFVDSADPDVLLAALPCVGGRGVANSITLAHGPRDLDRIVPAVRQHAARLVALCIDERGVALSATHKLEIAARIHHEAVVRLGLAADALIIDAAVFPLAKADSARRTTALDTITAVRGIKDAWPAVQTILGISDVSFGLPRAARHTVNAVFLHHCVEAGLDMAIADVAALRPYAALAADERELAEDLVFDRRRDARDRLLAAFSGESA